MVFLQFAGTAQGRKAAINVLKEYNPAVNLLMKTMQKCLVFRVQVSQINTAIVMN